MVGIDDGKQASNKVGRAMEIKQTQSQMVCHFKLVSSVSESMTMPLP